MGRIRADLRLKKIILIVMGILAAVSLVQGCKNAVLVSQDFQWDAAKALTLHINPYDESLSPSGILDSYDFEKYYLQMEANQFPSLLWLLFPYTLLPPLAARYAWLVSNLLFTAGIIYLLRKTFLKGPAGASSVPSDGKVCSSSEVLTGPDRFTFAFFMLLMIAGTPYRNQLGVGQHTLFAFFFFLLAVYLIQKREAVIRCPGAQRESPVSEAMREGYEKVLEETGGSEEIKETEQIGTGEKDFCLGAALALSVCYFKYTLTVPLAIYFIYKRRFKEIFVSVIPHIVLTAFSAWWLNDSFLNMIVKPLKVSMRLLGEGGLDFHSLFPMSGHGLDGMFVVICIYLADFARRLGKKHEDDRNFEKTLTAGQDFSSALLISELTLWSLIITYHRTYDFFVIVVVLAFICRPECPDYLKYLYAAVLIGVFFVLRVFSENLPSKLAVGAVYYIFTFLVSMEGEIIRIRKGTNVDNTK